MDKVDAADLTPAVPILKPLLILAGVLVAAAIVPQRDPNRLVPGLRCALVSEREASEALHTTVRLEPSEGDVCRFVSTEFGDDVALVIVARRDADVPPPARTEANLAQVVVANGRHNALMTLRDGTETRALRRQAEDALARLVAIRLGGAPFAPTARLSNSRVPIAMEP